MASALLVTKCGPSFLGFARGANAHLSDDEIVAKMGHPD